MTSTRTSAIVVGAIALVVGFLLLIMGRPPTEYRDADRYYMDDPVTIDRPTRAIISNDLDILQGVYTELAADSFVLFVTADPEDLRIQAVGTGAAPLFVGIAPTGAIDQYLEGVAHDEIDELVRNEESKRILEVQYTAHQGTGRPNPPSSETFWEASVEGAGPLTLDWTLPDGDLTAVIMNADASSSVSAEVAFGAAPGPNLDAIGRIASTVAVIAMIGGLGLLLYGLATRHRSQ